MTLLGHQKITIVGKVARIMDTILRKLDSFKNQMTNPIAFLAMTTMYENLKTRFENYYADNDRKMFIGMAEMFDVTSKPSSLALHNTEISVNVIIDLKEHNFEQQLLVESDTTTTSSKPKKKSHISSILDNSDDDDDDMLGDPNRKGLVAAEFAMFEKLKCNFQNSSNEESDEPLEFYKAHQNELPLLSDFVKKLYSALPTSTPVERLWSAVKLAFENRPNLSGDMLSKLMFIRINWGMLSDDEKNNIAYPGGLPWSKNNAK